MEGKENIKKLDEVSYPWIRGLLSATVLYILSLGCERI